MLVFIELLFELTLFLSFGAFHYFIGTASFKVKIPNGNMRVSAQLDELGDVVMRQVAEKLDIPKERWERNLMRITTLLT